MSEIEISPIVEFYKLDPCDSKQGKQQLVFGDQIQGKVSSHRKGIREALEKSKGIYIFYDSRGRAIYAGKTTKQNLWKEINLAYNRNRGSVQKIRRTKQFVNNVEYKSHNGKERVISEYEAVIHELAHYVSVYHISSDDMISPLEALIVRGFANDLLDKKMEKFAKNS